MSHFTYVDKINDKELFQGDILENTSELSRSIEKIHSYFTSEKYTHFLVLTQSCDLQKRDKEACKSKYITLAAIKPLDVLLERYTGEITKTGYEKEFRILDNVKRTEFAFFIERLLNNNESEYFYLHSTDKGLTKNSVAFLKVSITLKSELHYNTCLRAKRLQLKPPFEAKLGWLVGNIYSRVGTPDWVPEKYKSYEEFRRDKVYKLVDENVYFSEDEKLILKLRGKYEGKEIELSHEKIQKSIEELKEAEIQDKFNRIWRVIRSSFKAPTINLSDEIIDEVKDKLEKNPGLMKLLSKDL